MAAEFVTTADVIVLYRPEPASYRPDGGDRDLSDQGKSFDVTCIITRSGRMSDCQAEDNSMADQNFVNIAVRTISQWVVGPQTRSGEASAGRILIVTCRFQLQGQEQAGERNNGGRVASR